MKSSTGFYVHVGLALGLVFMAGCATVKKPSVVPPSEKKEAQAKGVYHKVHKGETLWRIAKTYKVSVEDIIRTNNIPNAASIEESQLLLIPGADVVRDVIAPTGPGGKDAEFTWPAVGKVVSYFEDRKGAYFNRGIDIKVDDEESIKAAREGRVVFADHLAGYGYTLIVDHADGLYSVYGHNEKILVGLGDYVFRGEKIAMPAREGGQAYEHFEIRKGDAASNPLYYLP